MLLTLVAFTLVAGAAFGATATIPVKGGASQLLLTSDRDDAMYFRIDVGSLTSLDVTTKAGDFTRLTIPGFHSSHVEGAPELPMMNELVAIPFGASARVEVVSVQSRTIDLSEFGVTNPLFPAQPPVSKSADVANLPFVYDRAAYQQAKVAIFFLAFLPQFADPVRGSLTLQLLLLGVIFIGATLLLFGSIAWFAASLGGWLKRSPRAQITMNRITGTLFTGLALRLATSER